jgi:hypothetical protein
MSQYNLLEVEREAIKRCFDDFPEKTLIDIGGLLGITTTKLLSRLSQYEAEGHKWASIGRKMRANQHGRFIGKRGYKRILPVDDGVEREPCPWCHALVRSNEYEGYCCFEHMKEALKCAEREEESPFWNPEENPECFKPRAVMGAVV